MDIVVGGEELAELDCSPLALQPNESLARSERRAAGVALHGGFGLEDGVQATAEVFDTAQPKSRRIAADAVDRRIGSVALPAVNQFQIEVKAAVELEIGKLSMRRRCC